MLLILQRQTSYLYCDELDKHIVKMLKNPLDMFLHVLRNILCVNKKTYDIGGLMIEKEKERVDYLNNTVLDDYTVKNDNGELYLYFTYNNKVREFFFPNGTFDVSYKEIDFKVR